MPGLLIADDMPITRTAIARIVARDRPQIGPLVEVSRGDEAVEVARAMRPDVVLMDIAMPGLDGISAGAQIRADHPATGLVILSAYEEFSYARQAMRIGAVDYLLKPIRSAQLLAALDHIAQLHPSGSGTPTRPAAPLARQAPEAPNPLARALAYMQRNLHRSDLRLSQVAEAALVSPSHLAALIRRHLGHSYLCHLTQLRIERAKLLLRTTSMTVAAVATAVGYETPAPFYHHFKQAVGSTPSDFRSQLF